MKISDIIVEQQKPGLLSRLHNLAYSMATGKVAGPEAKTKIDKLERYREGIATQAAEEIKEKKQDPKSYFQSFFGGPGEPDEVRLKVANFLDKNSVPSNIDLPTLKNIANKLIDVQVSGLQMADQRGKIQLQFQKDLVDQYGYNALEIDSLSDRIYKDYIVYYTGNYNAWLTQVEDKIDQLISKSAARVTTPTAPPIKIVTNRPLVVNYQNKEYEYDIGTKAWRTVATGRAIRPALSDAITRAYRQISKPASKPQVFTNPRTGKVSSSPIIKS